MDSFFDFDTGLPPSIESDAGRGRSFSRHGIDSEEGEYDALNDETFGDPDNKGDWEDMHEILVRMAKGDDGIKVGKEELLDDDDLDLHFSTFDLTDGDESLCSSVGDLSLDDEVYNRLRLDPSIWDSPVNAPEVQAFPQFKHGTLVQNEAKRPLRFDLPTAPIRMLSVADIERNIIEQQRLKKEKGHQFKLHQQNRKNKEVRKSIPLPTVTPAIQQLLPSAQFMAVRNQMFPPPPLLNHQSSIPVGFLPYNFLPTHYPTPINNLAMHPGFPAGIGHQLGLFPRIPLPIQPSLIPNVQNNQFNQKLVQEIQQNHPLLSFHRQQNLRDQHKKQRYFSNIPNGADFDEHANMMTNREKQWLIGIQLTQLNSDTPYINDYYFTVYKERLAKLKGSNESTTYQDNQLNHPFTQPKGHAQLLLMSSLAISHRDRKNSESTKNGEQKDHQPRSYTPLQFENSLGKLQCGSVKAPRKIIDMDVVGQETPTQSSSSGLRKSRHILLHIETLYKLVLKMEDLKNPTAIEAARITKEKRERENYEEVPTIEPESFDELLEILVGGLSLDKVTPMLGVRKGKVLLRRVCVLLRDHPDRWTLWKSIFLAIPLMLKKDRDDQDGILFGLYTEFERHVQYSTFLDLLKLSQLIATEKVLQYLTSCKFLLSSIITIVFQMEVFFSKNDTPQNETDSWIQCLSLVTSTTNKLLSSKSSAKPPSAHHTIKIERENRIVGTVRAHLERFRQHVKGNDFLDFITEGEDTGSSDAK